MSEQGMIIGEVFLSTHKQKQYAEKFHNLLLEKGTNNKIKINLSIFHHFILFFSSLSYIDKQNITMCRKIHAYKLKL
jgi:hypothetical protein